MPLCHFDPETAELMAPGPYTARSANDRTDDWPFWYVTNDGRRNVLRFPGCGGAVLTSRECAMEIARRANECETFEDAT